MAVVVTSRMGDNVSNDELQTLAAKVEALTTKVNTLAAEVERQKRAGQATTQSVSRINTASQQALPRGSALSPAYMQRVRSGQTEQTGHAAGDLSAVWHRPGT